jgi:dimethylamine corrinoid protein
MKEIERILKEENLKPKVKTIIGGGATSKEFSNQIGSNAWAYDAVEAVQVVQNLLK